MSVQLQMHLPESAATGTSSLLAPLRVKVGRLEADAQTALDALDEDLRSRMGLDDVVKAVEWCGCAAEVVGRVRAEIRDAVSGRDGWDTWKPEDRDRTIIQLGLIAHAFGLLARASVELEQLETAEVAALKGKP